jgi:hypothetical protein
MKGGYTARDSNQTEGAQRDKLSYAAAQGTVPTRWPKLHLVAYHHHRLGTRQCVSCHVKLLSLKLGSFS